MTPSIRTLLAAAVLATVLAAAPSVTAAQQAPAGTTATAQTSTLSDSALDAQTAAVSSQLRCPVCQGESIQDSPSELSMQMRQIVKEQLRSGKTPDEVKAYFVSKYGEWILLDPMAHGFNLVLYAAPYVLLLAGFGVVFVAVRRWSGGKQPDSAGP